MLQTDVKMEGFSQDGERGAVTQGSGVQGGSRMNTLNEKKKTFSAQQFLNYWNK